MPDEKAANELKNNISRFLQDEVFPEIEALLDSYPTSEIIRFERIEIAIEDGSWQQQNQLRANIRQALLRQLEIQLGPKASGEIFDAGIMPGIKMSHGNVRFSTLLYFLENGSLPWFGKAEYWAELQDETVWKTLLQHKDQLTQIRQLLVANPTAFTRFMKQLSLAQIFAFVEACDVVSISDPERFGEYLAKAPLVWKNQLLKYLLGLSVWETKPRLTELVTVWFEFVFLLQSNASKPRDTFREELVRYFDTDSFARFFEADESIWKETQSEEDRSGSVGEFLKEPKREFSERDELSASTPKRNLQTGNTNSFFPNKSHEILVANAGLILTIPFLRTLFRQLNLLGETNGLLPGKQELAIKILHFIATGDDDAPEFQLLFEKLLCGIPLGFPLQRESRLNDLIRRECDNMLKELILRWPALKSTSADGLRQLFLQRNGKLMETENRYRLLVERKAQDVLLERLPWNIAVLQLPFSKQLLFTEW